MIFFYSPLAGQKRVEIDGKDYQYLFQVRREKQGEEISLQNMKDDCKYTYKIDEVQKRSASLHLIAKEKIVMKENNNLSLHLAWGKCDPKTVYKTLPFLNELGVKKITFLQCQRTQGKSSYSQEKLMSLCISSSQQCGRNTFIEFDEMNLNDFLEQYPKSIICDISENNINTSSSDFTENPVIIGPEGGFTEDERKLFLNNKVVSFAGNILRSETACVKIASMI